MKSKKREQRSKSREQSRKLERLKSHPQLAKLRGKKNGREKRLYETEYGQEKQAEQRIITESFKVLIFASVVSAFGGFGLELVKESFVAIIPLVILLPVLNDMIGNFGTVVSSRFTTMLHEGYVRHKWWHNVNLRELIAQVFITALLTGILAFFVAIGISSISGNPHPFTSAIKIFAIILIDIIVLVSILIVAAFSLGLYFYNKKLDPSNKLIPITTSIADFGNMIILAVLVVTLF